MPEDTKQDETKQAKIVSEEVTFDAQRVVETREDGSTTFRGPTFAEHVGRLLPEIQDRVLGIVPQATSSAATFSEDGDERVTVHINLSRGDAAVEADADDDAEARKSSRAAPTTAGARKS